MKRKLKRIVGIAAVLVIAVVGVAFFAFRNVSQSGSGLLEQWIGSQLQLIANSYLNPQLSFKDLDYQYPLTVSLKDLRLTADDPANPGEAIDIVGCGHAVVTLAEVPSKDKPIVIEKIVLDQPLFSAIAGAPKSREFVGFSHLIRTSGSTQSSAPAKPATAAPAPSNRPKLSDVFRIRLIDIKDGKIVYDARIPGTDAMTLDQINTTLNIESKEPGWYQVSTAIARKPVFDISVAGQVNLDSFSARDMAIKVAAALTQDKLDYLPPQIQQLLKQYEVKGSLDAKILARQIQVMDPMKGEIQLEVKLNQANVTLGEFRIPIDSLDMLAKMQDGKANLPKLSIAALKGTANITGSAILNDKIDGDLSVKVAGMMLQQLLAGQKEGQPMKLAGKLNAGTQINAPLKVVFAKVKGPSTQPGAVQSPLLNEPLPDKWGSATINLTEARLIRLPVIQGLTEAIGTASKLMTANLMGGSTKPTEKFNFKANFSHDQINVEDYNYVGDAVAARGNGTVTLDRKLNLKLYGGPVEKVQSLLGEDVGGVLGAVTDQLVSYRVTGTSANPQIKVEVGNGVISDTTKKVGEGVGKIGEGIGQGIGNILNPGGQK